MSVQRQYCTCSATAATRHAAPSCFLPGQFLRLLVPFALIFTLSACELLESSDDNVPRVSRVLVANGGNFGDQNGRITSFDPASGTVEESPVLSGFLQGMAEHEGQLFTLLNTFSVGRIDVLDTESFAKSAQIDELIAPRSIAFAQNSAFVTNFIFGSNGHISVISLESGRVVSNVDVGVNPEGIIISGSNLYVANSGDLGDGGTISIVDTQSFDVETILVPCDGPRDLFGTGGNHILVACTGKTVFSSDFSEVIEQTNGSILFYDASLEVLEGRIDFDVQLGSTNGTGVGEYVESSGELYLMDGATNTIFVVDVSRRQIARREQLGSAEGLTGISGIAYDARDERLYVGRFPKSSAGAFPDFTSSGTVEIYDRNFNTVDSFLAGVSISQILLLEDR